jgi:hypothetical protein
LIFVIILGDDVGHNKMRGLEVSDSGIASTVARLTRKDPPPSRKIPRFPQEFLPGIKSA